MNDAILIYSDGSALEGHVGTGISAFRKGKEIWSATAYLGCEDMYSVADAERHGLLLALRKLPELTDCYPDVRSIDILSDSAGALGTILEGHARPGQSASLAARRTTFHFLCNWSGQLRLAWIPGHENIPGNERADELAKKATKARQTGNCAQPITNHSTLAAARRRGRDHAILEWNRRWHDATNLDRWRRFRKVNISDISLHPSRSLREFPRRVASILTQFRTGHAFLGSYRRRFRKTSNGADAGCPCGMAPVQTREHILADCPLYDDHRHLLRRQSPWCDVTVLLGTLEGQRALVEFIRATGAGTLSGRNKRILDPTVNYWRRTPDHGSEHDDATRESLMEERLTTEEGN
jgi:ribonuclease HI